MAIYNHEEYAVFAAPMCYDVDMVCAPPFDPTIHWEGDPNENPNCDHCDYSDIIAPQLYPRTNICEEFFFTFDESNCTLKGFIYIPDYGVGYQPFAVQLPPGCTLAGGGVMPPQITISLPPINCGNAVPQDNCITTCELVINFTTPLPPVEGKSDMELYVYGSGAQGRIATVKPRDMLYEHYLTTDSKPDPALEGSYHARYVNEKQYEIKDHLGNVRALVSDMKMEVDNHPNGTTVEAVVNGTNSYYPFGMTQHTLTYPDPDPDVMTDIYNEPQPKLQGRYGFNGMERDAELKGGSNSYDFGARIYDPRLGRWLSLDPLAREYPGESDYAFVANSPLMFIDMDGKYGINVHYRLTYDALTEAGISTQKADQVAWMASTHADNADEFIAVYSNVLSFVGAGSDFYITPKVISPSRREALGGLKKLKNSQSTEHIKDGVAIHAMKTTEEGISPEEAVDRALWGGQVFDIEGDGSKALVEIEGAWNVVNSFAGVGFDNLSIEQLGNVARAIHTIQDAPIHKGGVWDSGGGDHPHFECACSVGAEGESQSLTDEAVGIVEGSRPEKQRDNGNEKE